MDKFNRDWISQYGSLMKACFKAVLGNNHIFEEDEIYFLFDKPMLSEVSIENWPNINLHNKEVVTFIRDLFINALWYPCTADPYPLTGYSKDQIMAALDSWVELQKNENNKEITPKDVDALIETLFKAKEDKYGDQRYAAYRLGSIYEPKVYDALLSFCKNPNKFSEDYGVHGLALSSLMNLIIMRANEEPKSPFYLPFDPAVLVDVSLNITINDTSVPKNFAGKTLVFARKNKELYEQLDELVKFPNPELHCRVRSPLHEAALNGELKLVKDLLKAGANINAQEDDFRRTPLHLAIENWYNDVVIYLIEAGADINAVDEAEETPLHYAVSEGNEDIVAILIKAGAIVDIEDEYGCTPLDISAKGSRGAYSLPIVKMLIEANDNTSDATDVLREAIKNGYLSIVKYLLSVGTHLCKNEEGGFLIITRSCENQYTLKDTLKLLLAATPVSINAINKNGEGDLHRAIRDYNGRDLDLINMLIEAGANVNMQDADGQTPLHWAMAKCETTEFMRPVVWTLLKAGANPKLVDKYEMTPLHVAKGFVIRLTVDLLVGAGLDINAIDWKGCTALHYQVTDIAAVKSLLKRGAEVNIKNEDGKTPLDLARSESDNKEIIKSLSKPDCMDFDHEAIMASTMKFEWDSMNFERDDSECDEIFSLFWDYEFSKNNNGKLDRLTPLLRAITNDAPLKLIRFLLSHGAHVKTKTLAGEDALALAMKKEKTNLILLLEDYV